METFWIVIKFFESGSLCPEVYDAKLMGINVSKHWQFNNTTPDRKTVIVFGILIVQWDVPENSVAQSNLAISGGILWRVQILYKTK